MFVNWQLPSSDVAVNVFEGNFLIFPLTCIQMEMENYLILGNGVIVLILASF